MSTLINRNQTDILVHCDWTSIDASHVRACSKEFIYTDRIVMTSLFHYLY